MESLNKVSRIVFISAQQGFRDALAGMGYVTLPFSKLAKRSLTDFFLFDYHIFFI
jgi:hypothetical protein